MISNSVRLIKNKVFIILISISFIVVAGIIYSGNLSHIMNNSVDDEETGASFDNKNIKDGIVTRLTNIAKEKVGNDGSEFGKYYWGEYNDSDWCAAFIWWLFNQDNTAKKLIKKEATADGIVRESIKANLGTWYEDNCENPNTNPQPGDLVVFDPYYTATGEYVPYPLRKNYSQIEGFNTKDEYLSSHIGFVYKVDSDGTIHTIEGNRGNTVVDTSYSKDYCNKTASKIQGINGYFRPNYVSSESKYTLSFNANGGSGNMSNQVLIYGVKTPISKNQFKRNGFWFMGWYAKRSDGKWLCYDNNNKVNWADESVCKKNDYYLYKDGMEVTNVAEPGKTTTMYAQWENRYTLSFNANGGSGFMYSQVLIYGVKTPISKNTFGKEGYKFLGWTAKNEDGKWLCYDSNKKLNWVDESACKKKYLYSDGMEVTNTAEPGKTTTMYAQWKDMHYTLSFNANGGSGNMQSQLLTYGVKTSISRNMFSRYGYKFLGWYAKRSDGKWLCYDNNNKVKWTDESVCRRNDYYLYSDGMEVTNVAEPGKTTTMEAQWDNRYILKFNAGGGTGTMRSQLLTYGVKTSISRNLFSRYGYRFLGWHAKNEDGKWLCKYKNGKVVWTDDSVCKRNDYYLFSDGAKVTNTAEPGKITTMYAQWKYNLYTLRFNRTQGSGDMPDQTLTYGRKSVINANKFTRKGYKFKGWHAKNSDGKWLCYDNKKVKWTSEDVCRKNGNNFYLYKDRMEVTNTAEPGKTTTLYAQWKRHRFTITFDRNGATKGEMKNQTVQYGERPKITNGYAKDGYDFDGWLVQNLSRGKKYYCYGPTGKLGYYDSFQCGKMYKYANGATIADIANDGENLLFIAQWHELVCSSQVRCEKGDPVDTGVYSYCLIDYGKAVNGKCSKGEKVGNHCYKYESAIREKKCVRK